MVAAFDDVQRRGLAKFLDDGTQQIEARRNHRAS